MGGATLTAAEQWVVVALSACANMVNQADRIVMSVAIVPMSYELALSPLDQGWIISAFSYGYVSTQVLAGPLARRYGPGKVLTLALVTWCSLTMLTPLLATTSLSLLLAARVCMGISEGFCWPSTYQWISHSVDASRRARSFSFLIGGGTFGQLLALVVCPQLQWQMMFFYFGFTGLVWVTWYSFSSAKAAGDPEVSVLRTLALYLPMVRQTPVRAIIFCQAAHSWGHLVIVNWLPTYLHKVMGVSVENLWVAALPLAINASLAPVHGFFADWLHGTGVSLLTVRRLLTAFGMFVPAVSFALLPHVTTQFGAIAIVCVACGAQGFLGSGLFSNFADVLPSHAGMGFGLGNTAATVPGMVVGPFTAWIIANGNDWGPVFYIAAAFNMIGGIVYALYSSATAIDLELKERNGSPAREPL